LNYFKEIKMKDKGVRDLLMRSGLISGAPGNYKTDGSGLHVTNFTVASQSDINQLIENQNKLMNGLNALVTYLGLGMKPKRIFHDVDSEVEIFKLPK